MQQQFLRKFSNKDCVFGDSGILCYEISQQNFMDASILPESTTATVNCENCTNPNPPDLKFCPICSFPVGGADEDKSQFRIRIMRNKQLIKEAKEKIQTAKIIMYVLAGLTFLVGVYQGFSQDNFSGLVVNCILSLLYLIMIAWVDKNPFAATLSVFILYITVNLFNAFFDPATLFSGIILKIIVIVGLIKGIQSAKEAQDGLNELEKVKAATPRDR